MKLSSIGFLWVLLSAHFAFQPQFVSAAPGDEHWSDEFGLPGTATIVHSVAKYKDRFYVAGENNITNTTVNVWDGIQWSGIGLFSGSNPIIYDLAWVGNTLYAAGFFTNVNGTAIRGLARWDGTSWTDIGFNGIGYGLAVDGNNLYVGGAFTNVGPVAATNIACWNGSAWSSLGNGLGGTNSFVLSIEIGHNLIYAGGSFTNSGSLGITNLAQWNGSAWSSVGGGVGTATFPDRVYALKVKNADLYATGIFSTAGGISANGIARWNGSNWSALGSGFTSGTPLSLAAFGDSLCAGGSFTSVGGITATNFAIWNGSSWAAAGSGLNSVVYRVFGTGTNLLAGGFFFLAGNKIVNQIASWDGATWNPIGPANKMNGLNSFVRALVNDGTNLYAGGGFTYAGQTNALNVGRFDGTNWSPFGTGLNNNVLALSLVGTNLYAGGMFTGSAGGPSASRLARWNGSNWVPLTNFSSTVVNALATRGNDLFIAGYFTASAADGTATWLARWDGTNLWKVMAFAEDTFHYLYLDNIGFTAVAADANNVYVSGNCGVTPCDPTWTFCTTSSNVMRFDGTYMRGMGTGLSSNANAIAIMGANVYFGGPFTNAGGVAARGIARWDGAAWSNVGGSIVGNGTVNALAVMGTNLYAGGTFTNMGGVPANRIARWNGSGWSPLGSGIAFSATAGVVSALSVMGDDLYVGGTLRTAGGKPANFLARWNEGMNFDEAVLQLNQPVADPDSFQFTITSIGVPTYVIERSSDLVSWTSLLTNTITPYDCIDSNTPIALRQFYRARSHP